jgi:hypothetical protein
LQLDPQLCLAFLPQFQAYRDELKSRENVTEEDGHVVSTVDVLIEYLRQDYRSTVAAIENSTSHGEITFELLFAIMVPRSIMVTTCPVTGELQALQLVSATKSCTPSGFIYDLMFDGIDFDDVDDPTARGFGRVQSRILLPSFAGTVKITSLDAYPIQYHPRESELRQSLIARGRTWAGLTGIHHMHYKGTGGFKCQGKVIKYNVRSSEFWWFPMLMVVQLNSRVLIDRGAVPRVYSLRE